MFTGDGKLTGGNGTKYQEHFTDSSYAHTDQEDDPGYFYRERIRKTVDCRAFFRSDRCNVRICIRQIRQLRKNRWKHSGIRLDIFRIFLQNDRGYDARVKSLKPRCACTGVVLWLNDPPRYEHKSGA